MEGFRIQIYYSSVRQAREESAWEERIGFVEPRVGVAVARNRQGFGG
jgi:hypothetical protein